MVKDDSTVKYFHYKTGGQIKNSGNYLDPLSLIPLPLKKKF